ncbi:MAG: apolipoprotein N-acyltransferase [Verrucomicrobia bacterium]|nr:apolipoprotein N-acyltransferase [Verrucomicrobiota bacterium]
MKNFLLANTARIRWLLTLTAGVLLALAFPKASVAGLAWIAPGMMLFTALGCSGRDAFRLGFAAGLAYFLVSLYWLCLIPFPIGALAAWLSLSGYCALFPALWVWLAWKMFPRPTHPPRSIAGADEYPTTSTSVSCVQPWDEFATLAWSQRMIWSLSCAALWVALEFVRGRFLSGFPWNFVGVSQYQLVPLIQIASVAGVYGVSFLVVWFSVSLASTVVILVRRPGDRWAWRAELVLPLIALALLTVFGFERWLNFPKPARELKVALVQPSIPQTLIWNPNENTNRFQKLIELSELALTSKPDLLIWPEAAVPNMLRYDDPTYRAVTNLVQAHQVWMILGSDDAARREDAKTDADVDYFNSSFLLSPAGEIAATYRKRRLVIFGEYVPLARWLPFLKYLTPISGGFTPGREPVTFQIPSPRANASVFICFEDAFPHLAREYVNDGTDFLLNLTNDGWFGESAAQWQQAAMAVFRAVENGIPLVRCTNNGLTCWIDSIGRMHEVYFGNSSDVYQAGFKAARIPLLANGEKRAPTFYHQHGDWFAWSCVAWLSICVSRGLVNWRNSGRSPQPPVG